MLRIIIAFLAVIAGFAVWLQFFVHRAHRRQLHTLSESACPACGTRFGPEAAERARQEYLVRCREARRQRPDLRINFVRYWEIRCARCGAEARFHYETERFVSPAA